MAGLMAGKLRDRVAIFAYVTEQDIDTGETSPSWCKIRECWAEVYFVSGKEKMFANAEHATVSVRITIRYNPNIDAKQKLVHKGKEYNIKSVIPDNETGNTWLTLMCEAGVRHGVR